MVFISWKLVWYCTCGKFVLRYNIVSCRLHSGWWIIQGCRLDVLYCIKFRKDRSTCDKIWFMVCWSWFYCWILVVALVSRNIGLNTGIDGFFRFNDIRFVNHASWYDLHILIIDIIYLSWEVTCGQCSIKLFSKISANER